MDSAKMLICHSGVRLCWSLTLFKKMLNVFFYILVDFRVTV